MFKVNKIVGHQLIDDEIASDNLSAPLATKLPFSIQNTVKSKNVVLNKIPIADGVKLAMGFDAEWKTKGANNHILSWQVCVINDKGQTFEKVYYPKKRGQRFTLDKFLSMVVEDCRTANIISKWPEKLIVCCHFLRADLASFGSFWDYKTLFKGQSTSVTAIIGQYSIDDTAIANRRAHPKPLILRDKHRKPQQTIIEFVDTLFLAPNKSPLSSLGEMLHIPKVIIPAEYSIERMDILLEKNKSLFESYAQRDAEIAVKYALRIQDFLKTEFGVEKLPRSLGSVSVSVFRKLLKTSGLDHLKLFGLEVVKIEKWNPRTGKPSTKRQVQPDPHRRLYEQLATQTYHGGRNECYITGPTPLGDWYDWDLKGAYTTALISLFIPDYARAYPCSDPLKYTSHTMGFAYVDFEFPPETRFPCLVVRSEQYGLRFPLKGKGYATAPEIELALCMGAKITIEHGVIIPWLDNKSRIFEDFTRQIQTKRATYPKKSLEELIIKEIGNSLYGKCAQGLGEKTGFDVASGLSKKIGPSAVTNPYMAAHTTGFIRAVIGELLHKIPAHRTVVSVTTDGFLTDAPLEELDQAGPLCRQYQALCEMLHGTGGDPVPMLELKHHARQIVAMKTRGQCTAVLGDTAPVLAKAGVKSSGSTEVQNEAILALYLNRTPGQTVDASHLISLREQWITERDMVEIQKQVRLNYEPDQKRQLVNPRMVQVRDLLHIACDSKPWSTSEEADHARARFDGWRETGCLKSMEDWESWEDSYESALACQDSTMRVRDDGSIGVFIRVMVRVLAQKAWFPHNMSYREIAELFTSLGYPVTVDTCKNNKRGKLYEHAVPVTTRVLRLLALLRKALPQIPLEPLFAPSRLDEVLRRLAEIEAQEVHHD